MRFKPGYLGCSICGLMVEGRLSLLDGAAVPSWEVKGFELVTNSGAQIPGPNQWSPLNRNPLKFSEMALPGMGALRLGAFGRGDAERDV